MGGSQARSSSTTSHPLNVLSLTCLAFRVWSRADLSGLWCCLVSTLTTTGYGSLYCRRGNQSVKYEGNLENDDLCFGKIIWDHGAVYTGT